jgi:methylmalonyl-CoA mutase, C-terminal domain
VNRHPPKRVLIAKTGLDGHWRGVSAVAHALRDAGFEVIFAGMARPEQIVAMALQEDVDLVGLNIGGRIEVALRTIGSLRDKASDIPVFVGGTLPPASMRQLADIGVQGFPPGSSLSAIVDAARRLTEAESSRPIPQDLGTPRGSSDEHHQPVPHQ